ncbi:serine/threonine protein kinase [Malonomonas rubra DSM 5091]|uniref:non-specific serine/threonine protein kinase n=1 Tax=Malonomonas rubra DSM 5091 TaxID=1122189 RepID=A0A1M6GNE9_MALRU|nr:serine/threonine-protein kinase [Malonomonas rubra]SHJ11433.1 serine/threonine protein kinase [Malonomonas rubra DSM 5091]
MRHLKKLLTSSWLLCPLLALAILAGSLTDYPLLQRLELPIYDRLLALRGTSMNPQVVLLTIDQQSRATLGDELPSRAGQLRILKKLHALGVRQLALLTPLSFSGDPDTDQLLTEQLRLLDPVLPVEPLQSATVSAKLTEQSLLPLPPSLPGPKQLLLLRQNPLAVERFNPLPETDFLPPAPPFAKATLGHLQFPADADGRIRRHPLLLPSQGRLLPSVPLQLVLQQQASELQLPPRELPGTLRFRTWQTSIDRDYQLLLDLSGRGTPYLKYSVSQLLSGELDDQNLAQKLVLLGSSERFADQQPLATRSSHSTSELAALATATLVAESPPSHPAWAWLVETLVLAYFLVLLLLLTPRLSARAGSLTLGLFFIGWVLAATASLVIYSHWLRIAPALLLCGIGFCIVRWNVGRRNLRRGLLENHRQLALNLQEQGHLDQALEKFLQFAPRDAASKEMLYNLGLDFERKRMPHKALTAYRHLLANGRFRDIKERIKNLQAGEQGSVTPQRPDATIVLDRPGEKPTLGRYRIERELGQGAMGTVYLGIDPKINREVAIKTLAYSLVEPAQLQAVKERFFREAEAAGKLNHPKIVTIYDVGEENDLAYLAMELLNGKTLSDYCQPQQLLEPLRVVQILKQVAQALDYAHQQGVVHRDIKPANIILLDDGQIKVADFGIARMVSSSQTETGVILGTPSYMSPEQVAGKKVDDRSDLFSLGVMMYELLSGEKPFQGESMGALMYNIANCTYRPLGEVCPQLPGDCQRIVGKLLQKTLTRRFKSAGVLANALEELQQRLENG